MKVHVTRVEGMYSRSCSVRMKHAEFMFVLPTHPIAEDDTQGHSALLKCQQHAKIVSAFVFTIHWKIVDLFWFLCMDWNDFGQAWFDETTTSDSIRHTGSGILELFGAADNYTTDDKQQRLNSLFPSISDSLISTLSARKILEGETDKQIIWWTIPSPSFVLAVVLEGPCRFCLVLEASSKMIKASAAPWHIHLTKYLLPTDLKLHESF